MKPVDRHAFDAAFKFDAVGPLSIVKTFSAPAALEHTDRHVKLTSERRASLLMPIEGSLTSSHYGHDVTLAPGDFVLSDSFAPSRAAFVTRNCSIGLMIPYALLTQYLPAPEALFGKHVCGSEGFGEMVNVMLCNLWTQVERGIPPALGDGIARSFLELLATAYAIVYATDVAESSVSTARRAQIKRFIERHLREADLTANAVAAGLGLSARYIRSVFHCEGESVSDYILRRRLEECARQLSHVLWQGRSLTDTAFDWGFSSMAHFTRAFKERFGMTPTDYRRQRVV